MALTIVPVTKENRAAAEQLAVRPDQQRFIETVKACMEEADQISLWHPVLILHDATPIGFSMYGYWVENGTGRLWFDRMLIDCRYQHHGYGREAISLLLHALREQFPGEDIYLSVYEDNGPAIGLYQFFGFQFNGELDINGEKVMVLPAALPLP